MDRQQARSPLPSSPCWIAARRPLLLLCQPLRLSLQGPAISGRAPAAPPRTARLLAAPLREPPSRLNARPPLPLAHRPPSCPLSGCISTGRRGLGLGWRGRGEWRFSAHPACAVGDTGAGPRRATLQTTCGGGGSGGGGRRQRRYSRAGGRIRFAPVTSPRADASRMAPRLAKLAPRQRHRGCGPAHSGPTPLPPPPSPGAVGSN